MEDSQSTDSEAGREGRALCRGRHSLERSYSSLCKQEPFKENKTSFPFLAQGGLGELTRVLKGWCGCRCECRGWPHLDVGLAPPRQSFQPKLDRKFLPRRGDL